MQGSYGRKVTKLLIAGSMVSLVVALLLIFAVQQPAKAANDSATADLITALANDTTVLLTMTVGTLESVSALENNYNCSQTDTITIPRTKPIVYCYLITNTSDITYTTHSLESTGSGPKLPNQSFTLTPRGGLTATAIVTLTGSLVTSEIINSVWTATSDQGTAVTASDSVTVTVLQPQIALTYTVGLDVNGCGTTTSVIAFQGGSVAHCLEIRNTGELTLTNHTVSIQGLNLQATFPYTLPPGATLLLNEATRANLGITQSFIQTNVTQATTSVATVSSQTELNDSAQATANVSVDYFRKDYAISVTTSPLPSDCPAISVPPLANGQYYICIQIRNSSNVSLTNHTVTIRPDEKTFSFYHDLGPSQQLNITYDYLKSLTNTLTTTLQLMGPYTQTANVDRGASVTSFSPQGYSASASSQLNIIAATSTPTPTPTRTPTSTPKTPFPDTPTWTATPVSTYTQTPIPTATQTLVPIATPDTPTPTSTLSYAVSVLATPTAPVNPFATQTQIAVEQTVQASQFQQPTLDPVFVQQTQVAIFPTQTYEALLATGQIPPTVDPNLQLTPVLDPNLQQNPPVADPNLQSMPMSAPVSDQPVAPAEQPSATFTVQPIPTETPTITLTPEPTVRPIVPPTPPPSLDSFTLFGTVIGQMVSAASWVWFFLGTTIFLVAAFFIMALALRTLNFGPQNDDFDLIERTDSDEEENVTLTRSPRPTGRTNSTRSSSDNWPNSLP